MGSSGGHRKLPGGSDDFSLQTNRHTLHHNIYIIINLTTAIIRLKIIVIISAAKSEQISFHVYKLGERVVYSFLVTTLQWARRQ